MQSVFYGTGVTGFTVFSPEGEFEPLFKYSSLAEEAEEPYWLAQSSKVYTGSRISTFNLTTAVLRLQTLAE